MTIMRATIKTAAGRNVDSQKNRLLPASRKRFTLYAMQHDNHITTKMINFTLNSVSFGNSFLSSTYTISAE